MKFFIDTAMVEEIRQAEAMGLLDGVTTNPSLMARALGSADRDEALAHLRRITEIVSGPVNAEVVGTEADDIVTEGLELARIAPNIVVKVPMLPEGLKAIKRLKAEGIRTNCTLVFSPVQALLAAKAGADYISPFIGRLDDIGHTGMDVIREMRAIFDRYQFSSEVLAASIRHPLHVKEAALAGADVCTMPFKVLTQLAKHALTDVGLEQFLADWRQMEEGVKQPANV